jgi:hypothetical protein
VRRYAIVFGAAIGPRITAPGDAGGTRYDYGIQSRGGLRAAGLSPTADSRPREPSVDQLGLSIPAPGGVAYCFGRHENSDRRRRRWLSLALPDLGLSMLCVHQS